MCATCVQHCTSRCRWCMRPLRIPGCSKCHAFRRCIESNCKSPAFQSRILVAPVLPDNCPCDTRLCARTPGGIFDQFLRLNKKCTDSCPWYHHGGGNSCPPAVVVARYIKQNFHQHDNKNPTSRTAEPSTKFPQYTNVQHRDIHAHCSPGLLCMARCGSLQ